MIAQPCKVAQIRLNYFNLVQGDTLTSGFEFLNKEGRSVLKVGAFDGPTTKVFKLDENEQVIGIKEQTDIDPANPNHGRLYNLQFKIAKFI
jgi:hypothetical protein